VKEMYSAMPRYGAGAPYPTSNNTAIPSNNPREADFIRQFSSRIMQLSDPLLREVLDPLVLDAREFSSSSFNNGKQVVGAVESALLRAPPNKKYAICIFVDALCRTQSQFPFKSYFAQNLEKVFSVSCLCRKAA